MSADDFNARYKKGDVLLIGSYYVLFAGLEPGLLRRYYNAITYYALLDRYDCISAHPRPVRGIGYIEEYGDTEVKLVPNKKKRYIYERIAKAGYKWDSKNNCLTAII